jgi:hypothetical protein
MRRNRPRWTAPLRVPLGERSHALEDCDLGERRTHRAPMLMPPCPKPVSAVLGVLMAAAGLAVAGRRDAQVELLPGEPVTVLLSTGGRARAVFVLPISGIEAAKIVKQESPAQSDHVMDVLWEEARLAEVKLPDEALDEARGGYDAC